jgi:cytoskeleton protein RodZ
MSDAPMNENTSAASPIEPGHQPLHLLRQAREARGVHMAVLSVALKVSVKKFEALEAGRYEELPGLTFARALAASACRHLKIDPAPVLAQIPMAESPRLGYAESSMDAPFHSPSDSGVRSPVWLSRQAVLASIALVLGALFLVFWPETDLAETVAKLESQAPALSAPAPTPATVPLVETEPAAQASAIPMVTEPVQTVSAAVPMPAAVAPVPTPTVTTAPSAATATPVAAASATVTPAVATPPAPVAAAPLKTVSTTGSLMSIKAISESWVEVTNAGGTVLLRRLLKTGEVVDFASAPPYAVLLGRADAAEVTVRGQRFDTTPFARNSVARFEVK